MRPSVSRKAIRSSPSSRTRTGGPSGSAISRASNAGIQYLRIALPIGVPGDTRVISSFSSRGSITDPPGLRRQIRQNIISPKGREMTDWLLRGGEVVDGRGGPRRRADVAITGDRVSAVGRVDRTAGVREIDVAGKIVAPGFIDVHTHDDRALFATPDMAAKASQGVTTVVTGNCGISLAPLVLDRVPPPPLDLLGDTADYRYASFADYFAALDRAPAALNAACLVGHSTLRVGTMTELDRPASSGLA